MDSQAKDFAITGKTYLVDNTGYQAQINWESVGGDEKYPCCVVILVSRSRTGSLIGCHICSVPFDLNGTMIRSRRRGSSARKETRIWAQDSQIRLKDPGSP